MIRLLQASERQLGWAATDDMEAECQKPDHGSAAIIKDAVH
jgi:hypothetical protein